MPVVDHVHIAAAGIQDGLQTGEADAEHRVKHHTGMTLADLIGADLGKDRIEIGISRISIFYYTICERLFKVDLPYFLRI